MVYRIEEDNEFQICMMAIDPGTGTSCNVVSCYPVWNYEAAYSPLVDLLNVKYILTGLGEANISYPRVYSGPDMWIYENLNYLPRAWFTTSVVESNDLEETIRLIKV